MVHWHGRRIRLHCYDYAVDTTTNGFAGGPRPYALWMERDDIEFVLTELGLGDISYGVVDPGNPAGPGVLPAGDLALGLIGTLRISRR